MVFKLVIGDKAKSWKLETEDEVLVGKSIGEKIEGKELSANFSGYEFEITGGSDSAGFPMAKDVEGMGLKRVVLSNGWGMRDNTEGLRLRKTVRGKTISQSISQINMKVLKHGSKKLEEIFPEQNKIAEAKPAEQPVEAAAPVA